MAVLLACLAIVARDARAQIFEDTTAADTLADTVDYTARYLRALEQEEVRVPVMPQLAPPGPRPALTRIVFTRDSIDWMDGATVGDLLSQVPGVYLWRGGFTGRPELVDLQGRGATSAEYYLDGLPFVAAGVDSLAVDPALFSISLLDRVEVERWPGQIKVHLFTRRHDRVAPRTRIAIARGDRDFARYEADLERRFPVGVGFALAADYLDSPTASGAGSAYSNTQAWGQGSYVPSHRFGIQYQLVHARPKRRPFTVGNTLGGTDTIGLGYTATRTDAQFRAALRSRDDGTGAGLDLIYARSAWDGAGVDQQINQLGGIVSYRAPSLSLTASGFHRTRWTPLDVRATLGFAPVGPLAASAEGVLQHHYGGRSSRYVSLAAGLEPVRGLALTGMARLGEQVAAPAITTDTAQRLRDFSAQLGWQRARVGLQVAYERTSAFSPFAYADYSRIPALAPSADVDWITVSARVAPVQWITVQSWYSDPTKGTVDGVPPTHSLTTATIRSKFWRTFRSGIFDLKAQLSMEAWGRGTIGRDASGTPINLRGATFFSTQLAIQLQSFMIYWNRDNISASKLTYVPGFRLPNFGSNFGVRWEFLN